MLHDEQRQEGEEEDGVGSLSPHGGGGGWACRGGGVELQAHEAGDDDKAEERRIRLLLSLVFCKPWPAAPWFAVYLEKRMKSVL